MRAHGGHYTPRKSGLKQAAGALSPTFRSSTAPAITEICSFCFEEEIHQVEPPNALDVLSESGVHADDKLRIVVRNITQHAEFTFHDPRRSEQVGNLYIQTLLLASCDKIDFAVTQFADVHLVTPSQELQKHNVLASTWPIRLTENTVNGGGMTKDRHIRV